MSSSSDPSLTINQIPVSVDFPKDSQRFYDNLTNYLRRVADAVNSKEGGLYSLQEFYSGTQYNTTIDSQGQVVFRNVYRKVFDIVALNGGAVAGNATVTFAHNITNLFQAAPIYANCTSSDASPNTKYFTVVYPDVYLTSTNVVFTNPIASSLTAVYVVAEYLKN